MKQAVDTVTLDTFNYWHLADTDLPSNDGVFKVTDLDDESYLAEFDLNSGKFNTDFKVVHWTEV